MLTITNVLMPDETRQTIIRDYHEDITLDGSDLLALPGAIDPHVHFRVPEWKIRKTGSTHPKQH